MQLLTFDLEDDYLLIGIHSTEEDYRLAYLLNKHLQLKLARKPQDLDYKRPRLNGLSWHNFIGLKNSKKKFESLLKDFKFYSVRDIMEFNL